ncbi:hypothetical protein K491DRAFT_223155 [Lophiostoma macrostomum CBS 122681]|uniref:Zn(2)-C6 fungal-type domain-containing protein n=1 Tax=Lophiostoma macrostomum CBS 122681 TaxID=1314788 RepID=A0A6A6SPL1_9PLEO|nr:hypothetical protein K491DRAFT_223155 [Lophiostoma macrostomum CBS 122681]
MGFSGKPSKGCAPCRAKRTKCDLVQPACTQCVRKNRVCTGYRNEQDLLFRNETKLVMRKAQRKNDGTDSASSMFADQLLQCQDLMHYQHPSRGAAVEEEAVLHFFANYNEKFFLSDSEGGQGGFDYLLPVFQEDMNSGGPIPEIIRANGLAALGNAKGCPELLVAARAKQVKVLRQLNKRLQDPATSLSNSSILTCLMLGVFENIICDSPQVRTNKIVLSGQITNHPSQCAQATTYHLKGASALASLRGPSQFDDDIGHGIYARMRGSLLAHCLQTRQPLPDFVLAFLDNEQISQRDFEPEFYKLLARLCKKRNS